MTTNWKYQVGSKIKYIALLTNSNSFGLEEGCVYEVTNHNKTYDMYNLSKISELEDGLNYKTEQTLTVHKDYVEDPLMFAPEYMAPEAPKPVTKAIKPDGSEFIDTGLYVARDKYCNELTIFSEKPEYDEVEEAYFTEGNTDVDPLLYVKMPMVKTEDGPYRIYLKKIDQ